MPADTNLDAMVWDTRPERAAAEARKKREKNNQPAAQAANLISGTVAQQPLQQEVVGGHPVRRLRPDPREDSPAFAGRISPRDAEKLTAEERLRLLSQKSRS